MRTSLPPRRPTRDRSIACLLAASALSVALGGCVSEVDLEAPELPAGTRAVVFVLRTPDASGGADERFQLFASAISGTAPPKWPALAVSRTGTSELFALAYGCSLADLGLEEGENAARSGSVGQTLPPPIASKKSNVSGLAVSRWTDVTGLPEALASLRYGEATGTCDRIPAPKPFLIEGAVERDGVFRRRVLAVALDDHRALVAPRRDPNASTIVRRFFEVNSDQESLTPTAVPLARETPDLAASRSSTGEVWMLGTDSQLWRGGPTDDPSPFSTVEPALGGAARYAGAIDGLGGASPDLFVVTTEGTVRHFTGAWTTLSYGKDDQGLDRPIPDALVQACFSRSVPCFSSVGIARTGPSSATWYVVESSLQFDRSRVFSSSAGGAAVEETGLGADVTAIAYSRSWGRVFGTRDGDLLRSEAPGTYERVGALDLPEGGAITAIAALGDGVVVGDERGHVYVSVGAPGADARFCEVSDTLLEGVDALVALDDDTFVAVGHVPEEPQPVQIQGLVVDGLGGTAPRACSGE